MKNIKFIILFVLTTSLYSFASEKINFNKEELNFIKNNPIVTIGLEKDVPPFYFIENDKYIGLSIDYLNLIEKKTGLKFKPVVDSWQNLLKKTKNKELDSLLLIVKNKYREKYLLFTKPYLNARDYAFTNSNKPNNYKNLHDLRGKKIAIIKDYAEEVYIKDNHPDIKFLYVNNILEAIDAVITDKADFLLSNIAIINYLANKYSINSLKPQFYTNEMGNILHMAVRNDYHILNNIINKALSSITIQEKINLSNIWMNKKTNNNNNIIINKSTYLKEKKFLYIANELDWMPFDYNEKGIPKGYIVDYIKLISQKLNLKPVFVTDEWINLINKIKNKKIDILPVVEHNKKREKFLLFSKPYTFQILSIITKKSRNDIINIDDLNNKKIGMVKGWATTDILKKNYPNSNVIEFESFSDVFNAIDNNFIDATVQSDLLAKYYINKSYYGKLKTSNPVTLKNFKNELYIGVRKDLKDLHYLINGAIESITEKELKALDKKWINISKTINFTKEERKFINENKINVITTNNWAPFNMVENNKLDGISIDFWNYIKDKGNLKTNIESHADFSYILNKIKEKKSDVITASTKTKDREEYSIFSDTYLKLPIGIVTLQDKNYISNISELENKKIVVGKNFSTHKLLKEKYPSMNFHLVDNVIEGLKYVSENKAFAYIDVMPVLSYNIKNYGYTNLKITGKTSIDFNLKFLIRKDYLILKNIINKILNKMSPEEKEKIYKKWLNVKIEQKKDYSLFWKTVLVFLIIILFVLYKNKQLVKYQRNLKKIQEELEYSLKNFKSLIDLNIAGVLIIENQRIRYLNDEIVKMLGYKNKSQLIGKKLTNILKENLFVNIYDNIHENYEIEAIKIDGSTIPILLKTKRVNFDNKESFILSIINLTEIKKKEEMLLQQSKMASLGEMIGNIAHQWRQPLSTISTAASGMKVQKEFDLLTDELLEYNLNSIIETTKFLSQTIDDFQNYIKDDKSKSNFDIKDCIEKVLTIVSPSYKNNFININTEINSIFINGFENELNQALLNILNNAKDAIKDEDENNRNVFISSYSKGNFAIIKIIDTAGGIDKEIIKRVFEPYFTTKHKSQGTGLGLYMTHKIITDSMKGSISIENSNYMNIKGTKVTLTIPMK